MSTAIHYSTLSSDNTLENAGYSAFAFFNRHLSVVRADTDELLDQVYRLRFRIYCVEREFENAAEHPDGRERDHDDCRSLHYLALDRASGSAVGTLRLILPRLDDDLPVLRMLGRGGKRSVDLPLATTAEVSRFAIDRRYRRHLETRWCSAPWPPAKRSRAGGSTFPVVSYGLIQAVLLMNLTGNITHVVALMAPALLRLLRRLEVEFRSMGAPVRHHGLRQAGWAAVAHVLDRVRDCHRELWEFAPAAGSMGFRLVFNSQ